MANPLTSELIAKKNLLSDPGAWLFLFEVDLNVVGIDVQYFAMNPVDIVWDGDTYLAFPVELETMKLSADGTDAALRLKICNIDRAMEDLIEEAGGVDDAVVTMRVVHSNLLSVTTPAIEEVFAVNEESNDEDWVYLALGVDNLDGWQFPGGQFDRQNCRYQFKDSECGYVGAFTTCDRTMTECYARGRLAVYGDFPAIPGAGFFPDGTGIVQAE